MAVAHQQIPNEGLYQFSVLTCGKQAPLMNSDEARSAAVGVCVPDQDPAFLGLSRALSTTSSGVHVSSLFCSFTHGRAQIGCFLRPGIQIPAKNRTFRTLTKVLRH